MNETTLEELLVKYGLVQAYVLEDPEGYDAGFTKEAIAKMADEIEFLTTTTTAGWAAFSSKPRGTPSSG